MTYSTHILLQKICKIKKIKCITKSHLWAAEQMAGRSRSGRDDMAGSSVDADAYTKFNVMNNNMWMNGNVKGVQIVCKVALLVTLFFMHMIDNLMLILFFTSI